MNQGTANATTFRARTGTAPAVATPLELTPRYRWKVTQASLDFATVFAAAMLTYWLYLVSGIGKGHFHPLFYAKIHLAVAAITVFALHGFGEYGSALGLLRIESIRRIVQAVVSALLLTLTLSFLIKLPHYSRLDVVMLCPVAILALTGQRYLLWRVQDRRAASVREPVLVYGAGETGRLLAQHLLDEHQLGLVPVGFLDDDRELHGTEVRVGPGRAGQRIPVVGGEQEVEAVLKRLHARMVFLAMPSAPSKRTAQIVASLERRGIPFYGVPSAGDLLFSSVRFGQVAGLPVFTRRFPGTDRVYETIKRVTDLVGATLLLVALSPILLLAAAAVRLTSSGPVIFRQTRVGLHGRPFTILKLRTMRVDSPRYDLHPEEADDGRITPVGRWLRRTSIDELPQLVNVLQGEMSLVGPRPEMPFVVDRYNDIQRLRLTVKPGVTGLWQISADRAFRIHDNLQYDLYYVDHRSALLDMAIVCATPFVLLARDRAR